MSKLRISGVIVPSMFDDEWFEPAIERGLITPLSRVEAALAAANAEEPLAVEINSPGGSVFAGNQMLNALVNWRNTTGMKINVEVGAMAASAAASIVAELGPVTAHANSLFMFHSASAENFGGPDAMEDMAKLLSKINAQAQTTLTTRYKLEPELVAEWFGEGRMGWLDANEAKEAGLVSAIIATAAEPIEFAAEDVAAMTTRGLAVAALLESPELPAEPDEPNEANPLEALVAALGIECAECTAQALATAIQERHNAAYDEGQAVGKAAALGEVSAELKQRAETAEALATEVTAERDKIKAENEKLAARVAALDAGFRGGGKSSDPAPATGDGSEYWEAVKELVENGTSKNQAMLTVQREHPEAYRAMIAASNKPKQNR